MRPEDSRYSHAHPTYDASRRAVQIDLNNPAEFTLENVRRLIASKDDSRHRQLRVTPEGTAYLSDEVGANNIDGLSFRFETWNPGNGYCGPKAAADDDWVRKVYKDLRENWPDPKDSYIDY